MFARRPSRSRQRAQARLPTARRIVLVLLASLNFGSIPLAVNLARAEPVGRPNPGNHHATFIAEAANRFRIPAAWIRAVIRAESAGNPRARSRKGAVGLMQVMPRTWAGLRVRHRLGTDPYDPRDNIMAGTGYIRELFDRYGTPGWIAAYNAGPGRYEKSLRGRPLPLETRAYVATVFPAISGIKAERSIMAANAAAISWTRAPLFVVQGERTFSVDPETASRSLDDSRNAKPVRNASPIAPQSGGLFAIFGSERTAQ